MNLKNKLYLYLSILFLTIFFILQLFLAKYDSQTTDEGVHLSSGYTYLTKVDFRFNPEHPALFKMLSATPLIFMNLNVPDDSKYWDKSSNFFYDNYKENRDYAEEFFYKLGNNAEAMLFWGRLSNIILSLLLGILIYYILTKNLSSRAGFFGVVLYVTNPIVLANGHLVTTDISVALGFIATIYFLVNFLKSTYYKNLLYFGLAFCFALLVKYTSIILLPIIIAIIIFYLFYFHKDKKYIWDIIKKLILSFVFIWIIIIGVYFFDLKNPPKMSDSTYGLKALNSYMKNSPDYYIANYEKYYDFVKYIFKPKDYFKGLFMMVSHTQGGHDSYLFGQYSKTGWWYYFPVLYVLKNYLLFVILFIYSFIIFFIIKKKSFLEYIFLISFLVYMLFASLSKANIGVRHILPAIIMSLLFSVLVIFDKTKFIKNKTVYWFLLLIFIIETILVFPNYLSYFNLIVGGSSNGYKVTADSNLDWGQSIKKIKKYINDNNLQKPYIDYFWSGASSLFYYDIDFKYPDKLDKNNPKGVLIIGASALETSSYNWLKSYKYFDRIGNDIFVYKFE